MEEKNYCVYAHVNKINGKMYIGITCTKLIDRWGSTGNGYKGQIFYNAIQKYGWDNFEHLVLIENVCKEIACECEIALIEKYKCRNPKYGYNISPGGDLGNGLTGGQCSYAKEVYQYDLDGKFIKYWASTIEAADFCGISSSYIHACCKKPLGYNKSGDFQWSRQYVKDCPKYQMHVTVKKLPIIYQYSFSGELIKIYKNATYEFENTYYKTNVTKCCEKKKLFFDNSFWLYEKNVTDEEIERLKYEYEIIRSRIKNRKTSAVYQFDEDYNFIAKYFDAREASNETGVNRNTIGACCRGYTRKGNFLACGYHWHYKDNIPEGVYTPDEQ